MATYKGIQGYSVQKLSSDPTASEAAGQLWYNSTSGNFKISVGGAGAWASGGALNTGRSEVAGIGTKSAGMAVGGNTPPISALSETYNGSAWSEGSNINTARQKLKGTGTTTAGMVAGGYDSPTGPGRFATEIYDGSSWTTSPGVLTAANSAGSYGIAGASSTSALIFGREPGFTYSALSETWNGSSWTEGNNLNSGRQSPGGIGIVTAALCVAGIGPPPAVTTAVESYNCTCWSAGTAINTARWGIGSNGTTAASMIYGGTPPTTGATESWNGSAWTEVADMATANFTGAPSQSPTNTNESAFSASGDPSRPTAMEEWSDPVYAIKTVTVS